MIDLLRLRHSVDKRLRNFISTIIHFLKGHQKRCRDSLTISGGTSKQFCNNKSSVTFSPYTSVVFLTFNAHLNQRYKGFALEFTSSRSKWYSGCVKEVDPKYFKRIIPSTLKF